MTKATISLKARLALRVQHMLGHVFFPLLGYAMVLALRMNGYRVRELQAVRKRFQTIRHAHKGPLLLCANHLTLVDSVLIDWALASNWTYLQRFALLPWNIPERDNFYGNIGLRIICYLSKCIAIERKGSRANKALVFDKLEYLLRHGHSVCIFPEGTRSRTGYLDMDNFGYGIGSLASRLDDITLVCVYLRGLQQQGHSPLPERGDEIHVQLCALKPQTKAKGRRAAREISVQVMQQLQHMEVRYFDVQAKAA